LSIATFVLALGAAPTSDTRDGIEVLEACTQTAAQEPVAVVMRIRKGTKLAEAFATKKAGDLLITEGELILDGDNAVLFATSICDGQPNQFLNNITIVGRLGGEAKITSSGKSASRSVAVNRYIKKDGQDKPEQLTDWFKVRGYGHSMKRLTDISKGALVEVNGMLEQRTSTKGDNYVELKCRKIKVHSKSKTGGGNNAASGTTAVGYDQAAFEGDDNDSAMPSNWN